MPDETVKSFSGVQTAWPDNSCVSGNTPSSAAWADDASGYYMQVTSYWNAKIYAPDGTVVLDQSGGKVTDSNGNYDSTTDTLGRTIFTQGGSSGAYIYTMSNAQGNSTTVYTVKTGTISANTNFGQGTECNGTGSPACTLTVVTEVDLPVGSKYTFGYDSGATGTHWGLLNSMSLPTMSSGQQISYSWNRYTDSMGNNYPWINKRTTPDSSTGWTYTPTIVNTCGGGQVNCQQTFTVAKPNGDNTVFTSTLNGGAWLNQVQTYTGSVSSANLLSTVSDCWNFVTITNGVCQYNTTTGSPAIGVQKRAESTTLPVPGGTTITKTTQYTYDSYGNISKVQENKYYTGSLPSAVDRTTSIPHLSATAYINAVIVNRPASITVTNSSGATVAQTAYSYDGSAVASATGMVNHDDTNYGTTNTVRGNVTQVQRLVSGSTYLTTSMTYDMTGQVTSSTDSKGNVTTYNYADNFYTDPGDGQSPTIKNVSPGTNAYLWKITYPTVNSVSLTKRFGYYWGTGQISISTDENGNNSYFHYYEPMDRPTAASLPNSGWTRARYSSNDTVIDNYIGITGAAPSGNSTPTCTGISGGCRWDEAQLDGLGRRVDQILESDPDTATTIATAYDINGRVASVSNPYRGSPNGVETPTYDGLNRVVKVTHPDTNIAQTYYGAAVSSNGGASSQSCSSTTYGLAYPVLVVDEAGNKRQTWTDGFGRVIETDDPGSSGSLTVGTCYTYDLNNNLLTVTSLGLTQTQKPTYTYDMASRITSKTLPESGTTCFYYTTSGGTCGIPGTGTLCSGDPTAFCRRTDARNFTTTYAYDALNRLTSKSYNDPSPTTPTVKYGYDAVALTGCTTTPPTLANANGLARRTTMCDGSGATSWSFDSLGNTTVEKRTINGQTKTINYAYNLDGAIYTIQYPGTRTITYTEGNSQRMTAAADTASSINYAKAPSSGAMYSPAGALASDVHGYVSGGFAGISESYSFNNRLEVTGIQATSSAGTVLNLAYSYVSGNNGEIATQTNNVTSGRTQSYTYDSLNRLLTAQTLATTGGDCWGQSFGNGGPPPTMAADALANLFYTTATQCSAPQPRFTMNSSNDNQFTGTGIGYDSDGDMTQDTAYTYTYDSENRIITASGMTNGPYCYTYDGNGVRVMKSHASGGSCTGTVTVDMLYWRNIAGNTIAETDGTGSTTNFNYTEYVFFAGRRIAQSNPSNSSVYYYFVDHLGSTRVATTATGTACYEVDYLPYGTENTPSGFSNTCSTRYRFTGYERDLETAAGTSAGNDYAFARYYNSRLGRFMSGDPHDGDITDPQTLNHYAYVRDNPINFVDPTGMDGVCVGGVCSVTVYGDPGNGWDGAGGGAGGGAPFGCDMTGMGGCGSSPGSNAPTKASTVAPPAPKPNTSAKVLQILQCAEDKADHYSLAGLLGAKKGTFLGNIAHAFGGNSVSGVIDVVSHFESGLQAASVGDSHGSAVATLQVYGDLALGGTAQGVVTGGMGNPLAQGLVGTATDAALGAAADTVGTAKIGVDVAIFAAAATYCAAHLGN